MRLKDYEISSEISPKKEERQMSSTTKQVVLFSLNGVLYGADVHQVREIREVQSITPVPYAPIYIEGVTNLRGEVIPVINLRRRFGIEEKEGDEKSKIMMVVQGGDSKAVGIVVDSVMEVMDISKNEIESTSDILSTTDSDCVLGVAKRGEDLIILLDLERILSKKDIGITKEKETAEISVKSEIASPISE